MDEWLDRYKGYVLVALAALVLMGGVALATRRPETSPLAVRTPPASPTVAVLLRVHVSGAVANVGVYSFRVGDRVEDAVAAAGGFTAEANPDGINLAARLADGQQVVIPKKGEPPTSLLGTGAGAATRKVSINSASLAELDVLPGIGPVTGQKIIDFRTKNGPFLKLEDLTEQKLVPSSTYEKIKELITL
ncbi:MAG: ComEA family DNA-binding protein [Chloroflexota bacterium]|nr:ComEA family DNA-binding protein [Chloroflexota bacterium]